MSNHYPRRSWRVALVAVALLLSVTITLTAQACHAGEKAAGRRGPVPPHKLRGNFSRAASLVAANDSVSDDDLVRLLVAQDSADLADNSPQTAMNFRDADDALRAAFANLTDKCNGTLLGVYVEPLPMSDAAETTPAYYRDGRQLCPAPAPADDAPVPEPSDLCVVLAAPPPHHRGRSEEKRPAAVLLEEPKRKRQPADELVHGHFPMVPGALNGTRHHRGHGHHGHFPRADAVNVEVQVEDLDDQHEGSHIQPRSIVIAEPAIALDPPALEEHRNERQRSHDHGHGPHGHGHHDHRGHGRCPVPWFVVETLHREAAFARRASASLSESERFVPVIRVAMPAHPHPHPHDAVALLLRQQANATLPPMSVELWHRHRPLHHSTEAPEPAEEDERPKSLDEVIELVKQAGRAVRNALRRGPVDCPCEKKSRRHRGPEEVLRLRSLERVVRPRPHPHREPSEEEEEMISGLTAVAVLTLGLFAAALFFLIAVTVGVKKMRRKEEEEEAAKLLENDAEAVEGEVVVKAVV